MGRFIEGADRRQLSLLPTRIEDWVDEDNPVHVIERCVRIVGSASWMRRARPKMLTLNCRQASSSGTSSSAIGPIARIVDEHVDTSRVGRMVSMAAVIDPSVMSNTHVHVW